MTFLLTVLLLTAAVQIRTCFQEPKMWAVIVRACFAGIKLQVAVWLYFGWGWR